MADILSLVTARKGSKSIPRKNIAPVAGKPLIAWTIEAALMARSTETVIVSTDDDEIAAVAKRWGAEAPFIRPAHLAEDFSSHIQVVVHAIEWVEYHMSWKPDYILLLQPTSPLRTAEDIDNAYEIMTRKNADSIVSVCETPIHPHLMRVIADGGFLDYFLPKPDGYFPRQRHSPLFHENGAIYLIKRKTFLKEKTWLPALSYPYLMPPDRSIDIDTPWEMHLADMILRDRIENKVGT